MRSEKWRRYTLSRQKKPDPSTLTPTQSVTTSSKNGNETFSSDSALPPAPDKSTQRAALPSAHGWQPPTLPTSQRSSCLCMDGGWSGERVASVSGEWLQVRAPAGALESPGGDNPQPGCTRRPLSALEKQPQFKTIPHPPLATDFLSNPLTLSSGIPLHPTPTAHLSWPRPNPPGPLPTRRQGGIYASRERTLPRGAREETFSEVGNPLL